MEAFNEIEDIPKVPTTQTMDLFLTNGSDDGKEVCCSLDELISTGNSGSTGFTMDYAPEEEIPSSAKLEVEQTVSSAAQRNETTRDLETSSSVTTPVVSSYFAENDVCGVTTFTSDTDSDNMIGRAAPVSQHAQNILGQTIGGDESLLSQRSGSIRSGQVGGHGGRNSGSIRVPQRTRSLRIGDLSQVQSNCMSGATTMSKISSDASYGTDGPHRGGDAVAVSSPRGHVGRSRSSRATLIRANSNSGSFVSMGVGGPSTRSRMQQSLVRTPSRGLLQASRSGGLRGLQASRSGGLRPFTRDPIVNASIERRIVEDQRMYGPGGTLHRRVSERSNVSGGDDSFAVGGGNASNANDFDGTLHSVYSLGGDFSLFTTDSINLRKGQQAIAEPIRDRSYVYGCDQGDDSFADHDTYVTRMSNDIDFDFTDFNNNNNDTGAGSSSVARLQLSSPPSNQNRDVFLTTKHLTEQLHRMGVTENVADDQSYCTMESGLTNDDFGFDGDINDDCYDDDIVDNIGEISDDESETGLLPPSIRKHSFQTE